MEINSGNYLDIYTDGGARGNPGPAAIGFVIYQFAGQTNNKTEIKRLGEYIGIQTNNAAEYAAILRALSFVKESGDQFHISQINIFSDSLLVVRQLQGIYKIKDNNLKKYFDNIMATTINIGLPIIYHHIRREKNYLADFLVNQALDKQMYNL